MHAAAAHMHSATTHVHTSAGMPKAAASKTTAMSKAAAMSKGVRAKSSPKTSTRERSVSKCPYGSMGVESAPVKMSVTKAESEPEPRPP